MMRLPKGQRKQDALFSYYKGQRRLRRLAQRLIDRRSRTYSLAVPVGDVARLIEKVDGVIQSPTVIDRYLGHSFDILGSGWRRSEVGRSWWRCVSIYRRGSGLEKTAAESRRIGDMIDTDYVLIDWHSDWRTGARWKP